MEVVQERFVILARACNKTDYSMFIFRSLMVSLAVLLLVGLAGAVEEINQCTTIDSAGVYELTTNIEDYNNSICIYINSNNVVFDGRGYTVDGNDTDNSIGIHAVNTLNVTVKNITVSDWHFGISYYNKAENSIIRNNNASNNKVGIRLYKTKHINLTNNNVSNNDLYGIYLSSSSNNNLTNNKASNNDYGIILEYSSNSNLTNNNAVNNTYGIGVFSSSNNNLTNNKASNNDYGIYVDKFGNNLLMGNSASTNSYIGIYLKSSGNSNLTDNNASNNSHIGIYLKSSGNSNLTNNSALNNEYGIYLTSSSNNNLTNNNASNNNYGIKLLGSNYNKIFNNYFNNTINAQDDGFNYWNITKRVGTNIIGGPYLGGNYWSDYEGIDTDIPEDGLGDTLIPYNSSEQIISNGDYLPLTHLVDSDGDGIPNNEDFCPNENAIGFDADNNGCIDSISGLGQIIETLPDEVLSIEIKNSLVSKVENAEKSVDKDADNAAINLLTAFIDQIEAQRGKKVSEETADLLIAYAQSVLNFIGAG